MAFFVSASAQHKSRVNGISRWPMAANIGNSTSLSTSNQLLSLSTSNQLLQGLDMYILENSELYERNINKHATLQTRHIFLEKKKTPAGSLQPRNLFFGCKNGTCSKSPTVDHVFGRERTQICGTVDGRKTCFWSYIIHIDMPAFAHIKNNQCMLLLWNAW